MSGLTKIEVEFIPLKRIIIPPLTSKASKTILLKLIGETGKIKEVVLDSEAYKPLSLSMIKYKNRYLYGTKKSKELVYLREGARYSFEITFLSSDLLNELIKAMINETIEQIIPLYNGKIVIYGISAEYREFKELDKPIEKTFKAEFLTPTQFAIRHTPTAVRFRLFPVPTLVYLSLVRHWNKYAPPEMKIDEDEFIQRVATTVFEADWGNLKPVTIPHGQKIMIRGIIGWCIYQIHDKEIAEKSRKLLAYAEYIGTGKSRTLGLGKTKITTQINST